MKRYDELSKSTTGVVASCFCKAVQLLAMAAIAFVQQFASAAETSRPNVVMILADDLGWSDTTLFGTTQLYKTPNIERLASRGMTFSRAYSSSPLCSPTRASVLTGLSPARTGITTPNCHLPKVVLKATSGTKGPQQAPSVGPESVSRLDTKYYTLAEMFKDQGYATAHFGKWHLGAAPYSPLEHGFDIDVPHWSGPGPAGSYVAPWKFPDFDPQTPDEHIEDRMANEAAEFMKQHKDKPFFLNYWMFSVHAPFDAKADLIDAYRTKLNPNDAQRCPTYAAMIESMDDAVGRLLDTLDELQLSENTIIIFASDNGGNMYNEVDGTTPTSNRPLRGGKATMYEGGVRGPAIVVSPGMVTANSRSEQLIQSCDFYPTILDLIDVDAKPNQSFDGISIVPALKGQPLARKAIFTYFPHNPPVPEWMPPSVSVHCDNWKLVRLFHCGDDGKHRYKLFDLPNDVGEENNLAGSLPQQVAELDSLIDDFLADSNAVLPIRNPSFDPQKYQPELEGVSRMKATKATKKQTAKPSRPVAGWQAGGTATCSLRNDSLVVSSIGGDPYCSYRMPQPVATGPLNLSFTMSSGSSGTGQVFWQEAGVKPAFSKQRSVPFAVNYDGVSHNYSVSWTAANPMVSLRIDPSTGTGECEISSMKLSDVDGNVIHEWTFSAQ